MTSVLKVRFDGRVLVPEGPVDLPMGTPLEVRIAPARARGDDHQSALQWLVENAVDDASLPDDLSENLDHYLYGTPEKKP